MAKWKTTKTQAGGSTTYTSTSGEHDVQTTHHRDADLPLLGAVAQHTANILRVDPDATHEIAPPEIVEAHRALAKA